MKNLPLINTVMNAAILLVLILILARVPVMPPTVGDFQNAKAPEQQQALILRKPYFLGDVSIDNNDLDVSVRNQPIRVEIER